MNNSTDFGVIQLRLSNEPTHDKIVSTISNFIINRPTSHIVIFNSYSDIVNTKNVPILHISQAKLFSGKVIVFDIESLELALNFINHSDIIYYASNIPWENSIKEFTYWKNLFMAKDIKIVASNNTIYDLFSIGFKSPVSISPEFSYEAFQHII